MDFRFTKPAPDLGQEYGKHRLAFFRLPLLVYLIFSFIILPSLAASFAEKGINADMETWLLTAFWLLWTAYHLANSYKTRVILHHNGIILRRLLLPDKTFYFQPDMRVFVRKWQYGWIFTAWKTPTRTQIRLRASNGKKLKLSSSWTQQDRVLAVLHQYQLIHTLPCLRESYINNETLDFSGVRLNLSGIWIKRKYYDLEKYEPRIVNGWLYLYKIKKNGKPRWVHTDRISLAKISEAKIFLDWIGFYGMDLNDYITEHYKINPFF